jgi:diacylglycerol kinase (ATP)
MKQAPFIQKKRKGIARLWHALVYSLNGLRLAWLEPAFRQEIYLAIVLIPTAVLLGKNWQETMLLIGSVLLIMIVELLNTGLESAIDRIGPEWHDLSKRAKDMSSAAVLLSILLFFATWGCALYAFFKP